MRTLLVIAGLGCAGLSAIAASRAVTVIGRVTAYSVSPACLNGNAYWSMLIRVQKPKSPGSRFIRVDFSLPCGQIPQMVSAESSVQQFHLFRNKDCDVALERSTDAANVKDLSLPIWTRPKGAGNDVLPFGQVLPCYGSVDLPLAPVL